MFTITEAELLELGFEKSAYTDHLLKRIGSITIYYIDNRFQLCGTIFELESKEELETLIRMLTPKKTNYEH